MRAEKQNISEEYLRRLNESPYFIVVDYTGLKVKPFTELRNRLVGAGSEVHVVKNSIFKIAAKEAGIADLGHPLEGQLAVVTGSKDVSAAAKVVKSFHAEFELPEIKFGFLENQPLSADDIKTLADLPSLDVLRGTLLGVIMAPATKLARTLKEPGAQLARVLKAKADKGE
jgi:large subunit ribosomal protein L10